MNSYISTILLTLVLFNSCKEDMPEQQDLGFFPLGEINKYFEFRPGTWWIYKNTRTGVLDTQFVAIYKLDTLYENVRERKFSYETFYQEIFSSTTKNIYRYSLGVPISGYALNWYYSYDVDREVNYYPLVTENCTSFMYPFDESFIGSGIGNTRFIGLEDSMLINGNVYNNVAQFKTDIDGTFDKNNSHVPTKYFYAESFGLVRFLRTDNNEAWELLKSNIVK